MLARTSHHLHIYLLASTSHRLHVYLLPGGGGVEQRELQIRKAMRSASCRSSRSWAARATDLTGHVQCTPRIGDFVDSTS